MEETRGNRRGLGQGGEQPAWGDQSPASLGRSSDRPGGGKFLGRGKFTKFSELLVSNQRSEWPAV